MQRETSAKDHLKTITTTDNKYIELSLKENEKYNVKGSEERLVQVLRNVLDNALSFSEEKGTVKVIINRGENLIAIHIDDTGPGIPEKKLETIFDRFYTERPAEFYGQNSGLGLSISKQIIESHRGEIFAENMHDQNGNICGARFSIILKATDNG